MVFPVSNNNTSFPKKTFGLGNMNVESWLFVLFLLNMEILKRYLSIRLFDKHLFFKMIHHIVLPGHSAYVDVLKTIRKPVFLENLAVKECFDHKFLKTPEIVKKKHKKQQHKKQRSSKHLV